MSSLTRPKWQQIVIPLLSLADGKQERWGSRHQRQLVL